MADLKMTGYVVTVATVAIWGALYYTGGASSTANITLLLGGSIAFTLLALGWAESYTP